MKNRRMTFVCLMQACFLLLPMTGTAIAATSTENFVQNASIGNQFEISSSQIALKKSQNTDVRQFAQQMIDDHTKIGNGLNDVVATEDLNLPQPSSALDSKHKKILDKLHKVPAADFDKTYIKDQIDAHKDAVSLFRDYSKNGDDPGLKTFAMQALPTMQDHQKHANALNNQ